MDLQEIREILHKKDGGRIDSYVQKNNKKKEDEIDLMNLLQTWTHSLIYHSNIYPPDAFTERQILGQTVHIASAQALTDYLDSFFSKLQPHLTHLNHLKILLISPQGQTVETHTLHVQDYTPQNRFEGQRDESGDMVNRMQKDIELKAFLYDFEKSLKSVEMVQEGMTFRLRVGYRMESSPDNMGGSLVDSWVRTQKLQKGKTSIKASLKSYSLNAIYEVEQ